MGELRDYICKKHAIRVLEKSGFIVHSNEAILEFPNKLGYDYSFECVCMVHYCLSPVLV